MTAITPEELLVRFRAHLQGLLDYNVGESGNSGLGRLDVIVKHVLAKVLLRRLDASLQLPADAVLARLNRYLDDLATRCYERQITKGFVQTHPFNFPLDATQLSDVRQVDLEIARAAILRVRCWLLRQQIDDEMLAQFVENGVQLLSEKIPNWPFMLADLPRRSNIAPLAHLAKLANGDYREVERRLHALLGAPVSDNPAYDSWLWEHGLAGVCPYDGGDYPFDEALNQLWQAEAARGRAAIIQELGSPPTELRPPIPPVTHNFMRRVIAYARYPAGGPVERYGGSVSSIIWQSTRADRNRPRVIPGDHLMLGKLSAGGIEWEVLAVSMHAPVDSYRPPVYHALVRMVLA